MVKKNVYALILIFVFFCFRFDFRICLFIKKRFFFWQAMHPCCPKCVEALERQKKKTQSMLLQVSQKEAISKAVGDLPAWSLPPSSSSSEPPKVAVAAASDAGDSGSTKADNLALSRLKPVGSSREDAKRASRVLLQAVIENYADRDSYQTPQKKGYYLFI